MRHLADRISTLTERQPWLAAVGVLLLAGALFLPSLHHLVISHDGGADEDHCPVCLLLSHNFLALPVLFALDLARRALALMAPVAGVGPASAVAGSAAPRAPPLSN